MIENPFPLLFFLGMIDGYLLKVFIDEMRKRKKQN